MRYTYRDWLSDRKKAEQKTEKVETVAVEQFSVIGEAFPEAEQTTTVAVEETVELQTEITEEATVIAPADEIDAITNPEKKDTKYRKNVPYQRNKH